MREGAQVHWIRVVLSQGAPFFTRLDRRLPALSSFLGQSPAQEIKWPAVLNRLMSMPISRNQHFGFQMTDAGNGGQHLDGYAKGFDVAVDLLIDEGKGRIHSVEMIQVKAQHKAMMGRHATAQTLPPVPPCWHGGDRGPAPPGLEGRYGRRSGPGSCAGPERPTM